MPGFELRSSYWKARELTTTTDPTQPHLEIEVYIIENAPVFAVTCTTSNQTICYLLKGFTLAALDSFFLFSSKCHNLVSINPKCVQII